MGQTWNERNATAYRVFQTWVLEGPSAHNIFSMGLTLSSERRPVFYFIGDSITEFGSEPCKSGFVTILRNHYVRSVDCINRGLAGYNSRYSCLLVAESVHLARFNRITVVTVLPF